MSQSDRGGFIIIRLYRINIEKYYEERLLFTEIGFRLYVQDLDHRGRLSYSYSGPILGYDYTV